MGRMGLSLSGDLTARRVADVAAAAEQAGFDSLWLHETYYLRDAWTALTAAAMRTRSIGLGTSCIGPFTRHPVLIAMSMASLMETARGPVSLGLGSGYPDRLDEMAVPGPGWMSGMRAAIATIRALCSDGVADPCQPWVHERIRLGFAPRGAPPIYVAGWGPSLLRLCAQQGDGYLARPVESTTGLRRRFAQLAYLAAACGRQGGTIERAAVILCHVDADPASARAAARRSPFLLYQFSVLEATALVEVGIDPEVRARIAIARAAHDTEAAARLVSDEMLDNFTAVGTAAQVAERLESFAAAGVERPLLQPLLPTFVGALLRVPQRSAPYRDRKRRVIHVHA